MSFNQHFAPLTPGQEERWEAFRRVYRLEAEEIAAETPARKHNVARRLRDARLDLLDIEWALRTFRPESPLDF